MTILQNRRSVLVLLILLFVGASVYVYFAYVSPLLLEIETKERELQAEEQLITALEARANDAPAITRVVTTNLQQLLPVKPMTEQLLLDLEKVELLSNSLITNLTVSDGETTDEGNAEQTIQDIEEHNAKLSNQNNDQATEEGNGEEQEGEETPEVLPTGVKKVAVQLTVESPSYFEMEKFLQEVERQIRIIEIEQLTFSGPDEGSKLEGDGESLTFNVTVAAYYMPELLDLIQDAPKLDTPDPEKKQDPFVRVN